MEVFSPPHLYQSLRRYWRRRKYQRLDGTGKRNVRVARFGGGGGGGQNNRRFWKLRVIPRLRLKIRFLSPIKILSRLRDAYVNSMLGLAGKTGSLHSGADANFGVQRVPKARVRAAASVEDFESRLLFEIYKSIAASRELAALR